MATRALDAGAVEDASLIVSELVANAIRHGRPLARGQIRVSWEVGCRGVEVAVSDGGSSTVPEPARSRPLAPGGKGLGIVERLAETWGVRREGEVTTVWALLPSRVFADSG